MNWSTQSTSGNVSRSPTEVGTVSRWLLILFLGTSLLVGCAREGVTPAPTLTPTQAQPAPVAPELVPAPVAPVAQASPPVPATANETLPAPPVQKLVNIAVPLSDMTASDLYKGEDGGLYGKGLNQPPPAHREAALRELATIRPLDAQGNSAPDGKVVLISVGMSNTTQEFSAFKRLADADREKSSNLVIVDGAQGGQTAQIWATQNSLWQELDSRLQKAGVTPAQVQVVWAKQANAQPKQPFPAEAKALQTHLATIVKLIKERYPNVRIIYLSSRIYAGYATTALNPEPHAFESAFSIRWLIRDQINGNPALNYNPDAGPVVSPLLLWGTYLWADGLNPRSDGLTWARSELSVTDGTHPSDSGKEKVARVLLDFFKTNELARSWFLKTP